MHSDISKRTCEAALKRHRAFNVEGNIYPSHNRIIDGLLERSLELLGAYEEIYTKLDGVNLERDLYVFFDGLLCVAATWNPDEVAKSRAERCRLEQVNQKIAKISAELADLLDVRETLNNQSGFCSDTHYDICQVIEDSSALNGHFNGWVKAPLAELKSRFDMNYWPSLAACIRTISDDAEDTAIQPSNSTTAAATTGKRAGDVDFFKAFHCRLCEEGESFPNLHPSRFKLSNPSLAVLASCALDRKDKEMFDADYVKRWHQRERDAAKGDVKQTSLIG